MRSVNYPFNVKKYRIWKKGVGNIGRGEGGVRTPLPTMIVQIRYFERRKHCSFKAFETNLEPVTFKRSKCKDLIYKENNYEEEYDSKNCILAWVISQLTVSFHSAQSIPSWSGFQQLLAETPSKATIGYLQPPLHHLQKWVSFMLLLTGLFFKKMFFEADEAIYSKLLDAMFKMS